MGVSLGRVPEFFEDRLAFWGHLPTGWKVVSALVGHFGFANNNASYIYRISDFIVQRHRKAVSI